MNIKLKTFIADVGGYKTVAKRLGKQPTTVHTHMQTGVLPASWYEAVCALADEVGVARPQRHLFSFVQLLSCSKETA
jgi:hypothetical protein